MTEQLEALAFAAWRVSLGTEPPTERVNTNGGPLDPDSWCMEAAQAVVEGRPIPALYKKQSAEHFREPICSLAAYVPKEGER